MATKFYGNLINRIMEGESHPKPVVGMGVTECFYSDREPYEIIEVKDEKHITIRRLDYKRIDHNGMSDCQEYEYFSNPENGVYHLVLRNGRWRDRIEEAVFEEDPDGEYFQTFGGDGKRYRKVGTRLTNKLGVNCWHVGHAEHYHDFSF